MKPKRLLVDIDKEFHGELKARAAKIGISLKEYVIKLLVAGIIEENKDK